YLSAPRVAKGRPAAPALQVGLRQGWQRESGEGGMAGRRGGSSLRYPPRRGLFDTVVGLRLGTLLKWMVLLGLAAAALAFAAFLAFVLYPVHSIPSLEKVD